MSKAKETFDQAILDAQNILTHFNTLNTHPPPAEIEVLKRAGLVMAMTDSSRCATTGCQQ